MPKHEQLPEQATISFDVFRLSPTERLLSKEGKPIELGGRAFDILVALAERAGQVVSKNELIDIVWPDTTVEEGSLRFHIASLRKALGDGESGARYVTTVYGGGYCLAAPVVRSGPRAGTDARARVLAPSASASCVFVADGWARRPAAESGGPGES